MIIAAFAGAGKTYCGKKYENVVDFDYLHFKYTYPEKVRKTKSFEELKGWEKGREINSLWPQNFKEQLLEKVKKYEVVLVPANDEILGFLEEMKMTYLLCYPKKECKPIYLKRYLARGTNPKWIASMEQSFEALVEDMEAQSCSKMVLQEDETLEDKLKELKLIKF